MNEKILCAAVWYKDLNLYIDQWTDIPQDVYSPVNITRGYVFCGHRHAQCIYTKVALTGLVTSKTGKETQGFLTSLNRFVDREEALIIALRENQVIDLSKVTSDKLYSEDLY